MKTFKGETWTISDIDDFWEIIDNIGQEWGISYPKTQIEILSSDQMIEVISTIGAPCSYDHWSIGKSSIELKDKYKHGHSGLALELIINSDPTVMYISENNTLIQQGLVLAHAGIGHGSVFKNNYLFKKWTHADSILDYLTFARDYIKKCEIKYGPERVETLLDMCHSLQDYGVSLHIRKNIKDYKKVHETLSEENQLTNNDILDPEYKKNLVTRLTKIENSLDKNKLISLPEENILYFLEKNSEILDTWEREVIRINRKIAEYFYPQRKTKILHEGWATFIEYMIFNELYNRKHIDEGGYLEFLRDHANVIYQPDHDSKYYSGHLNPYAIGFHIFLDLYRMTCNPEIEDWKNYPELCDTDWKLSLMEIVKNFNDETFIDRYLTDVVIKKFKLFASTQDIDKSAISIDSTANEGDYIRKVFSSLLNIHSYMPMLEISNIFPNKSIEIDIHCCPDKKYDYDSLRKIGQYIYELWGHDVKMTPKKD